MIEGFLRPYVLILSAGFVSPYRNLQERVSCVFFNLEYYTPPDWACWGKFTRGDTPDKNGQSKFLEETTFGQVWNEIHACFA